MDPTNNLIFSAILFVGSHFTLSHPLRATLAGRIGERGFQIVYSVVALATFILMVRAYQGMPAELPLWAVGNVLWAVASLIVLLASILFLGSLIGNPALAVPGAAKAAAAPARGVFAITRHPMMWGFALWAVAHIIVVPTPGQILLCLALIILALGGSLGQDSKKAKLMGAAWQDWQARTAFVPFSGQISGRLRWADAMPRPHALFGGIVVWLVATWAHGALGYVAAGVWRWL
ncbi:MAG: MFS transporter [Sphingopyxis sp.]|nr:MFS transporter [Sphingopyxis sp.]